MLKIYGAAHSRAFRVIWLAEESGIPYQHVPVTFGVENAQCNEPWYVALNPNGRLPTIDDDGFIMWESAAINLYLAEKYNSPLFPPTFEGKGRLLQWTFFIANDVELPLITALRNRVVFPPEKRNPLLADEAEALLRDKFAILEQQLAKTRFFGVDKWDMADFMVASVCYSFFAMKYDLGKYPSFQKWLTASLERPKAKEARALRE